MARYLKWEQSGPWSWVVTYLGKKIGVVTHNEYTRNNWEGKPYTSRHYVFTSDDRSFTKNHYVRHYLNTSILRWAARYLLEKQSNE